MLTRIQIRARGATANSVADELRDAMNAVEQLFEMDIGDAFESVVEGSPGRGYEGRITFRAKAANVTTTAVS